MLPTWALAALSCTATTKAADFGAYKATDGSDRTARGEVDLKCTCTLTDCIGFGYSLNVLSGGSGLTTDRRIKRGGGTETLKYQLYVDALTLTPWTAAQGELFLLTQFGSQSITYVYGKLFSGQAAKTGTYTDSPAVVITY